MANLFEELEGIDIEPASAVAVPSLLKAASGGQVNLSTVVLLNITGGGRKKREQVKRYENVKPDLTIHPSEVGFEALLDRIARMFF